MRKLLFAIVVVVIVFSFVSCNNSFTCTECGQKYEAKDNYCSNCGAEIVKGSKSTYTKGLSYMELPDGNYAVSAGDALYLEEVIIPSTYKGKLVTEIAQNGFCDAPNLKKVTLPDTIKSINYYGFCRCKQLDSINFPNGLKYIGQNAFQGCKLKDVVLPSSVEKIESHAFLWSYEIESVTIPGAGNTTIGDRAFAGCPSLISVVLGDGVEKIESEAFSGHHMTTLVIGKNVKDIGTSAFERVAEIWNLSSLQINVGQYGSIAVYNDISVPSKTWRTNDNYLFYEDGNTCYLLGNIDSSVAWFVDLEINLVLPKDCNGKSYEIRSGAFSICSIDSIVIPDNISMIDRHAFHDSKIKGNVYFTGTENQWKTITPNGTYDLTTPIYNYEQNQ